MPPTYERKKVDIDVEKRILTGLIVSSRFCQDALPIIRPDHFDVPYSKILLRWVIQYYKEYKKAPGVHIQDIFDERKTQMNEESSGLVSTFLEGLSQRYSEGDDEKFNSDYLTDQLRNHVRSKSLLRISDNIKQAIQEGKLDQAEKELGEYRTVSKQVSRWINPFDDRFMERVLLAEDEFLFKFPGKLGELTRKGLKRGWLVSFMGPMKRGKSWWLMEMAVQAVLAQLRVVHISLEMSAEGMGVRLFRKLTSLADKNGPFRYPVFDCQKNQDGSCKKKDRTSRVPLLKDGLRPKYENTDSSYLPCTVCRGTSDYVLETWFTMVIRNEMTLGKLRKGMRGFSAMWGAGSRFRMITYPAATASLQDIKVDLDSLEDDEAFVPDVIVIDYADILKPEDPTEEGRDRFDTTWKALKGLSEVRHCLVVTATQSTRKTLDSRNVKGSDTSEDIRKAAHLDVEFGLNQLPMEKKRGIIRINKIFDRWDDFDPTNQVTVLHALKMGQPLLDSEFGFIEEKIKEEEEKK